MHLLVAQYVLRRPGAAIGFYQSSNRLVEENADLSMRARQEAADPQFKVLLRCKLVSPITKGSSRRISLCTYVSVESPAPGVDTSALWWSGCSATAWTLSKTPRYANIWRHIHAKVTKNVHGV